MKKSVLIITLLLMFSFVTAHAEKYRHFFAYTDTLPQNGSVSADITIKNLKELEFLSCIDYENQPYDIKSITESILNSKIHIDINYKTRQDGKSAKIYAKTYTDTPLVLNSDLEIAAKAVFHIWIEYNFTNENSPYYCVLIKTPVNSNYYKLESISDNALKIYPSENTINNIKSTFEEVLRGNAALNEIDDEYTLSLNDSELKNTMQSFCDTSFGSIYALFSKNNANLKSQKNNFAQAVKRLNNIKLLSAKGIKLGFDFSKDNKLEKTSYEFNIDTNIFKVYYAATGIKMPADPNAPRPIINAANSDIQIKLNIDAVYKTNYTKFKIPHPSADRTTDLFDTDKYYLTYTTTDETDAVYNSITFGYTGLNKTFGGIPYLPLRPLVNSFGITDDLITWNDGCTNIFGNSDVPFESLQIYENSDEILCDGNTCKLSSPVITENGTMYVPEDFVLKFLNAKITEYTISYDEFFKNYRTYVRMQKLSFEG